MKIYLYFIFSILYLCSCENSMPIEKEKLPQEFKVNFSLPFDSENYPNNPFELFNKAGNMCDAIVDTVTKTGGHIEYVLPTGSYSYSLLTVFGDRITKEIKIDSDSSFVFYADCYSEVNVIKKDHLASCNEIHIIVDYEDNEKKEELRISRSNNQYWLKRKTNSTINWSDSIQLDNAKFVEHFLDFESILVGNQLVENFDEHLKYDYMNMTKVYIKCDNLFLEIVGVKSQILKKAFDDLIVQIKDK